jgi:tetratricopeptide (TPR) repeat protein/tRNA A-37 threonylcarbamoyl transferase component Bud32
LVFLLEELKDKYSCIEEISRGSTSIVYTAYNKQTGAKVAIKEFVYYSSEDGVDVSYVEQWQRFKREIEIHLGLSHENIIQAHEAFEINSKLFLVLDYVPAKTLQAILDEKIYLDIFEIINIVKQLAEALQYLHDKGIIHRDIKPGNILLSETKQVLLIDFGCSRKIYTENITTTRMIIGTINYMSPEQFVGYKEIDGRTDIFSLGCTFYQLLANNLPFKGEDIRETINNIFQSHPLPVRNLNPVVPFKLEVIVHQTLKKDPDHRCPTAKLLIHYLNKLLDEPEIHYNQGKYYERKGDLQKAYSFFKRAIQVNDNYFPAWQAIGELYYMAEDWKSALEYYSYLIKLDSANHDLYAKLGDIYSNLGDYPDALKMYQKAWILNPSEKDYEIKMANSLFQCHKINEAIDSYLSIIERYNDCLQAIYELGIVYYKIGQKKHALQILERARTLSPENQEVLTCLGALYQEMGEINQAIDVYSMLECLNPQSLVTLHNLACAYYQSNNLDMAREKLEILISMGVETSHSYILLGLIFEELKEPDKSIECYRAVMKFEPDNIEVYLYLAACLKNQWRLNESIDILVEATKLDTKYSKSEVYYQLAETYREKGLYNEAKENYQECLSRANPGRLYDAARKQLKLLTSAERKNRKLVSSTQHIN